MVNFLSEILLHKKTKISKINNYKSAYNLIFIYPFVLFHLLKQKQSDRRSPLSQMEKQQFTSSGIKN